MVSKGYAGDPIVTTTTADIDSGASTIGITASDGWPTGAGSKPFVVKIRSADGTAHEKILIASRTGTTLTVSARGFDSTVASAFLAGSTIYHIFDADSATNWNAHVYGLETDPHATTLLNDTRHADAALHQFGPSGALGVPSAAANVTTAAGPGSGALAAREDHAHMLGDEIAGAGLAITTGVLHVVTDDVTVTVTGDNLVVKAGGIDTAEIADHAVTMAKVSPATVTDGTIFAAGAIPTAALADKLITAVKMADVVKPRLIVANAAARPTGSARFVGMEIFQADTGQLLTYYGSTVQWQPNWSTAWGYITDAASSVDEANITKTAFKNITGARTPAFTPVVGRRYKTSIVAPRIQNVGGASSFNDFHLAICNDADDAVITNSVSIWLPNINDINSIGFSVIETGLAATSIRRKVMGQSGNASAAVQATVFAPCWIWVEDIGPSGVPS